MLFFFSLMSYPDEIAYFNSPNRELPNGAQVMELQRRTACPIPAKKKGSSHLLGCGLKPGYADIVRA